MRFWKDYKEAYEQIKADENSMEQILQKVEDKKWKFKSSFKKVKMKPVSVIIMLIVALLLGVNVPVFAKTILSSNDVASIGERIVALADRILEEYGSTAYTQYKQEGPASGLTWKTN